MDVSDIDDMIGTLRGAMLGVLTKIYVTPSAYHPFKEFIGDEFFPSEPGPWYSEIRLEIDYDMPGKQIRLEFHKSPDRHFIWLNDGFVEVNGDSRLGDLYNVGVACIKPGGVGHNE